MTNTFNKFTTITMKTENIKVKANKKKYKSTIISIHSKNTTYNEGIFRIDLFSGVLSVY